MIDFEAAYRHPDYPGVAWRVDNYKVERVYDGFPDWLYEDYEEIEDTSQVECHMVGDDRTFTFDTEDMVKLDEEEYCSCCGQIGCHWG